MKLILQKDVKNLGKAGEPVTVKKGYARNYLLPQSLAIPLNKGRLKVWKHQKMIIEAKKRKALSERKALIQKISSVRLKFEKESLKDGRLFGSVTAHEISQALEKLHNISVDKRDILFTTLKTVGEHKISIHLDSEHKTDLTLTIKGKITKKTNEDASSMEKTKLAPKSEDPRKSSEKSLKSKNRSKDPHISKNTPSPAESPKQKSKDKNIAKSPSDDASKTKTNSVAESPELKSKDIKT